MIRVCVDLVYLFLISAYIKDKEYVAKDTFQCSILAYNVGRNTINYEVKPQ